MSKPIGDLTLKAAPVGTDAVAIADSEDSDKTKKVLLSALPQLTATTPLDITSGVISIPQSATDSDGYLSSTDWNKFSQKAVYQSLSEDTTHTTASLTVDSTNFYNKLYRYTQPLTELTLSGAPIETSASTYRYETEIQFTTGATFTFTASGMTGKWLGVSAPTFDANTSYVIAIKNGYGVCSKVGA